MAYNWNWGVFLQPTATGDDSTYLDWMFHGLQMTIGLSLSAWLIALLLGAVVGVLRTVPNRWLSGVATAYVEFFRNIPLLVQLFLWYFVMPELLPENLGNAFKQTNPIVQQFLSSMICLALFTSARVAEQVRSGINSLPPGQKNAGLALGFTLSQTYRHVMLPMAVRLIVPPLTSEFLNIFKNSAVCSTIGLLELAAQGRQLVDYTAQPYESFIAVTVAYLLLNVVVMSGMRWVEAHVRVPGYIGGK
ncbi:MAG TPA: amino acid ABC transporter permease [Candidatus Accumulibacter phosphatis]|nr:MAG: putative glutamine ABC transporter permease protein GlnM [Candidatus Accumulibacter sp. SK-11]HAY29614.1 amino acid ABC transporter permease [Accumulibacter sp.]HRL74589.1 amino acid ABC transporter permease [Candidatus Accumulibacter phosphatis]HCN68220.1 amino acid ABC transporter permease [Accumulibacter sp.]HCV13062.1 amino acid ABC transporter permease [Accumulibacter sp.]